MRSLKFTSVALLSLVLALQSIIPYAFANESGPKVIEETTSPITVKTNIIDSSRTKGWDVTFDLDISLDVTIGGASEEKLTVFYSLSKLVDTESGALDTKIKDKMLLTKAFKLKEKKTNSIIITDLENGQYQLDVQALTEFKNNERLGGRQNLFFTVSDHGVSDGWDVPVDFATYGYDEKGKKLKIADYKDKENYGKEAANDILTAPLSSTQFSNGKIKLAATAAATFSGSIKEYFRDYTSVIAVKNARVELRYRDQFYIWRNIASTSTDGSGNFSMTYTSPSGANLWEVRVIAQNAFGKVIDQNGNPWTVIFQYSDLSTGGNIGNVYIPNNSATQKAFWLHNDILITHDSLLPYRDPGSATIVWYPSSTESARYVYGDKIYLNAASAQSKTTAIHELAHNYMYNIYNNSFPSVNCSSGHYYNTRSEVGCAWTEGWAHFLALNMNGSPIYTYTDGTQWNAENTSSFATGDAVEGRVAGALWDLRDTVNDGSDFRGYLFKNIYEVMYSTKIDTFLEYWNQWKAKGFDIGAKDSIAQNSINYS